MRAVPHVLLVAALAPLIAGFGPVQRAFRHLSLAQLTALHMLIFWICVVIGVVVFGAMFWSMYQHRKSRGTVPAQFHESTRLEIVWTLVPAVILIGMAFPATQTLIAMYDTGGEDMAVEVRGYQWKWQYKYLDDDYNATFNFFSNLSTPRD